MADQANELVDRIVALYPQAHADAVRCMLQAFHTTGGEFQKNIGITLMNDLNVGGRPQLAGLLASLLVQTTGPMPRANTHGTGALPTEVPHVQHLADDAFDLTVAAIEGTLPSSGLEVDQDRLTEHGNSEEVSLVYSWSTTDEAAAGEETLNMEDTSGLEANQDPPGEDGNHTDPVVSPEDGPLIDPMATAESMEARVAAAASMTGDQNLDDSDLDKTCLACVLL